jgi:hypothetical protein
MTAAITPDPGKSEVEIAAVQVVVDDIHHEGAPEAVTPFIPVLPGAFQLFEVRFDALIIWAEIQAAGPVNLFKCGAGA